MKGKRVRIKISGHMSHNELEGEILATGFGVEKYIVSERTVYMQVPCIIIRGDDGAIIPVNLHQYLKDVTVKELPEEKRKITIADEIGMPWGFILDFVSEVFDDQEKANMSSSLVGFETKDGEVMVSINDNEVIVYKRE